jgi:hypothetical protein
MEPKPSIYDDVEFSAPENVSSGNTPDGNSGKTKLTTVLIFLALIGASALATYYMVKKQFKNKNKNKNKNM